MVLVFAAIIAILLYRELPIAAFEAQRQKEHLLVSRGNQYKRGVKLFVRKIGRFPSSLDELENTNRLRFLRHRFVDPLTGKDDWRLIHAGPGGVILDSKVAIKNKDPKANALGQGAVFAGFNNSFSGDTTGAAATAADNTPSAGMRQRPAATQNAASGTATDPLATVVNAVEATDANAATGAPQGNGGIPLLNGVPQGGLSLDPTTGRQIGPVIAPNGLAGANAPAIPAGIPQQSASNAVTTLADQLNSTNPKTPEQATNSGLSNTTSFGPVTQTAAQTGVIGNQGSNQVTLSGGIAGVASKAEGKGITLVHDQKKYKLWEFYYDMRAEQNQGALGALGQPGVNQNGPNQPGTVNQNGQNGTTGQSFTSGGFGQQGQSSFGSSFSSGSSQQGTAPAAPPVAPPQP